jgi:hypothetical protein
MRSCFAYPQGVMSMRTSYEENEREITLQNISNFALNPFAFKLLLESYKKSVWPATLEIIVPMREPDPIQDKNFTESIGLVEVTLRKPGYLGKEKVTDIRAVDKLGARLFAQSYYANVRPLPVSFFHQGVEVHIRTPKHAESKRKNIARNIWNPTANRFGKIEL